MAIHCYTHLARLFLAAYHLLSSRAADFSIGEIPVFIRFWARCRKNVENFSASRQPRDRLVGKVSQTPTLEEHNPTTMIVRPFFLLLLFAGLLSLSACEPSANTAPGAATAQVLPAEDLPPSAKQHLQSAHPQSSIRSVLLYEEMGYEVLLNTAVRLYYSLEGEFLLELWSDEDDDDYRPIPLDRLPSSILSYIQSNFPNFYIVWARGDDDGFDVFLNNGYEVTFDSRGRFLYLDRDGSGRGSSGRDISISELPQRVLDYISSNFPDARIIEAELYPRYYNVYLNTGLELYFDLDGNFLRSERSGDDNDDDDDDDDDSGRDISISELPQRVLDYISSNFPDARITEAELYPRYYNVYLNNGL